MQEPSTSPGSLCGLQLAVTGGGGFIGSHLVARLVQLGARVRLLALSAACRTETRRLLDAGMVEFGEGLAGCEALVHLAYRPPAATDPERTLREEIEHNLLGLRRLLEGARPDEPRQIVLASSVSVYRPQAGQVAEDAAAGEGVSPYGAVKAMQERCCRDWAERTRGRCTILRLSSVYGQGETVRRAIPRFVNAVLEGRRPTVGGSGRGRFDPIYVGDVVDAFVAALERRAHGTYNIGSGHPRTSGEVAEIVLRLAGAGPGFDVDPGLGEGDRPLPDVRRAARELGFRARTPLEVGLRLEAEWFAAHAAAGPARAGS